MMNMSMFTILMWVACNFGAPAIPETLGERASALSSYAQKNGYSTSHFLLVDLGRSSSLKRAYLVGSDGSILRSGQVAHGHCKYQNLTEVEFSNTSGSNCSSEGRYRIAEKYTGEFGESYKLDGLDSTNSNARNRFIVLHSHGCVLDKELGVPTCPSEGCPTLSPGMLDELKPVIDGQNKPMLLWVYKDEPGAQ